MGRLASGDIKRGKREVIVTPEADSEDERNLPRSYW